MPADADQDDLDGKAHFVEVRHGGVILFLRGRNLPAHSRIC